MHDDEDKPSLSERFEAIDDAMEYEDSNFDKIPTDQKLHPSSDLCGMMYLASKMKEPAGFGLHGEHDTVLFSVSGEDDLKEPLTDDDIRYLLRCGIRWMSEYDSLGMFASL